MERRQSSFSGFFAARPSRIEVTSTTVGGGAVVVVAVAAGADAADAAGAAEGAVAGDRALADEVCVAPAEPPKILDMRLENKPITGVRFII
jgi:hypothetical protein